MKTNTSRRLGGCLAMIGLVGCGCARLPLQGQGPPSGVSPLASGMHASPTGQASLAGQENAPRGSSYHDADIDDLVIETPLEVDAPPLRGVDSSPANSNNPGVDDETPGADGEMPRETKSSVRATIRGQGPAKSSRR